MRCLSCSQQQNKIKYFIFPLLFNVNTSMKSILKFADTICSYLILKRQSNFRIQYKLKRDKKRSELYCIKLPSRRGGGSRKTVFQANFPPLYFKMNKKLKITYLKSQPPWFLLFWISRQQTITEKGWHSIIERYGLATIVLFQNRIKL